MESVFADGKTFVDCIARRPFADIRNRYETVKDLPDFSLSSFVHDNFDLPEQPVAEYQSVAGRPLLDHLNLLWDELTRRAIETGSSLITLPNAYIVPGGRFRE